MSYLFDCFTIRASLSFLLINLCGSCLHNVWLILSSFFLCDSLANSLILFSSNNCLFFLPYLGTLLFVVQFSFSSFGYILLLLLVVLSLQVVSLSYIGSLF